MYMFLRSVAWQSVFILYKYTYTPNLIHCCDQSFLIWKILLYRSKCRKFAGSLCAKLCYEFTFCCNWWVSPLLQLLFCHIYLKCFSGLVSLPGLPTEWAICFVSSLFCFSFWSSWRPTIWECTGLIFTIFSGLVQMITNDRSDLRFNFYNSTKDFTIVTSSITRQ